MSVLQSDVHFWKSLVGASVGGAISAVEITGATKNNFWEDISDVERLAGGSKTKKWFVDNEHSTDSMIKPIFWISQTPTNTSEQIGIGINSTNDADPDQGNMTTWGTHGVATIVSDGSDTRMATVVGIDHATGLAAEETVTLNGSTGVATTTDWDQVYATYLDSLSVSRTATLKNGSTIVGTIGISKIICWQWLSPASSGTGIKRLDLPAGGIYGWWDQLTWIAGVGSVRPDQSTISLKES